jgi:hypothetical protein
VKHKLISAAKKGKSAYEYQILDPDDRIEVKTRGTWFPGKRKSGDPAADRDSWAALDVLTDAE